MSITDARGDFAELVNVVAYKKERVALTRRGKPVAAIVPIEDLRSLEDVEAAQRQTHDQEASQRDTAGPAKVSWGQLKEQLGD